MRLTLELLALMIERFEAAHGFVPRWIFIPAQDWHISKKDLGTRKIGEPLIQDRGPWGSMGPFDTVVLDRVWSPSFILSDWLASGWAMGFDNRDLVLIDLQEIQNILDENNPVESND